MSLKREGSSGSATTSPPELLDRFATTVATIVQGIEAGVFPNHPSASSTAIFTECHPCEPDGLGVVEVRRSWERKRLDPALAVYTNLAEPLEVAPDEVEVVTVD